MKRKAKKTVFTPEEFEHMVKVRDIFRKQREKEDAKRHLKHYAAPHATHMNFLDCIEYYIEKTREEHW